MKNAARVRDAGESPNDTANECEQQRFTEENAPHVSRPEPQGQERPNFSDTLFEAELEHQPHQDERGKDEEKAEAEEQLAEVLPACARCQRLLTHGLK